MDGGQVRARSGPGSRGNRKRETRARVGPMQRGLPVGGLRNDGREEGKAPAGCRGGAPE